MKKAQYYSIALWTCPYVKCNAENEVEADEAEMSDYDKRPIQCLSCGKEVLLTLE